MLDPEENNLSGTPEYDDLEEEAFPPLPPPYSPGQGGHQEDGGLFAQGEEGEVSRLADVPAAKRKSVKRPQPKLDSQRLISERGLPALRTLFDSVRFKGKGHEAEDLRLLMQKMENWAHRLYPKLQFEDFIDKVEKLGSKKEVQTCLKRIRLDMPLTHEDFMDKDGEEEVPLEMQVFGDPDPFSRVSTIYDPQEPVHSTPAPTSPVHSTPVLSGPVHSPPALSALTEEQRRRMELNRQRALERRLARQQQQTDSQTIDISEGNEPTSVSSENVLNATVEDEKVEDLDQDPSISSVQNPSQPPPTESESPPTESEPEPTQGEGESSASPEHELCNGCEKED
ncbi:TIMELESS-interacting protein [Melanotaenia boesemani]|uniref:TIMELESS-interacting protein n=1 Tax=Melanotaenia boesemani TaxID=1250792 RepID=UPI001C04D4AF|nr:TIMELESS-interacting protein [Melanotaenia boesemani]XP_041843649.1 TIMELESS-interacting protein [Melanotaenia boesemani]